MYQRILSEIAIQAKFYGLEMQPPCLSDQLQKLINRAKKELQVDIPKEYAHFLQLHNGFDWNGLTIYATEKVAIVGYIDRFISGCVEANLIRRNYTKWKQFLIFGETGDEDYCLDIPTLQYVIVDSVSTDILEAFSSFDELVAEALRRRI